jgi:glycosyltransferase involved in cell wall biosynthesis
MNICIVTENYIRGGLNTFLWSLIDGWPSCKDEFTIIVNQEFPSPENLFFDCKKKVNIIYYSNQSTRLTNNIVKKYDQKNSTLMSRLMMRLHFLLINYFLFYFFVVLDIARFRNSNYDRLLVVNGGHPGGLNCRSAILGWKFSGKKPLGVLSFHNYFIKPALVKRILNFPSDFMLSRSISTLVSVSHDCLNSLSNEYLFRSVSKKVIYNGIPNPKISNASISLNKISNKRYCIMLASFEPRKGHNYLLTAFSYVVESFPNLELHMYGDGNSHDYERIIDTIRKLKLDNHAFLHYFKDNIMESVRNSDLLLVPSQSYESFGLSIIEAMSLGVPVIATNVGGMPEVLGASLASESTINPGILCDKDNPVEFGDAVLSVLSDSRLASDMGLAGRHRFIEMFQNTKMSIQYQSLFL